MIYHTRAHVKRSAMKGDAVEVDKRCQTQRHYKNLPPNSTIGMRASNSSKGHGQDHTSMVVNVTKSWDTGFAKDSEAFRIKVFI